LDNVLSKQSWLDLFELEDIQETLDLLSAKFGSKRRNVVLANANKKQFEFSVRLYFEESGMCNHEQASAQFQNYEASSSRAPEMCRWLLSIAGTFTGHSSE
jgi:hypothetical protein